MVPLSWRLVAAEAGLQLSETYRLPLSGYRWVCWADVPANLNWAEWMTQFAGNHWIVRGVPSELLPQVKALQAEAIPQGLEARLNLSKPHFAKKSLQELIGEENDMGLLLNYLQVKPQ